MKEISAVPVLLGPGACLLLALGCAAPRSAVETRVSPTPFVRDLADPCDYHLLLTGKPQTCGMRSGRVRLAPGKSIGRHNTKGNEELLVFLSGAGVALIGRDMRLQVGAGKAVYIPPQTAHDIVNTGGEPLVYVFCVAPAGANR